MLTLNLVIPEKSDIQFKHSKFPDGQQQITIIQTRGKDLKIMPSSWHAVEIKTRLNNFSDVEVLICAVASLRELGVSQIHLYAPYILGARSDRKFEHGSNNYLKTVICPLLNALQFDSITAVDPHSHCLEMGLNNFKKESNEEVVKWALGDIYDHDSNYGNSHMILASPDAGATKKVYHIAETIEFDGPIITCSKDRGIDGKLNKCYVPLDERMFAPMKDIIVIDDICDGGATFINIAKEIKEFFNHPGWTNKPKIYLIITHGIFSKGTAELMREFNGVYCTNSFQNLIETNFKDTTTKHKSYIRQFNIF